MPYTWVRRWNKHILIHILQRLFFKGASEQPQVKKYILQDHQSYMQFELFFDGIMDDTMIKSTESIPTNYSAIQVG